MIVKIFNKCEIYYKYVRSTPNTFRQQDMSSYGFSTLIGYKMFLVKYKMNELAFWELTQRQKEGEKGRTIVYRSLCMARYLLPETNLTVSEKTDMFALRSQMNENPCNFGDKINCQMGCSQTQEN